MKKTRSFLLAASIMLALAFTFSCSSDDDGKGDLPEAACYAASSPLGDNTPMCMEFNAIPDNMKMPGEQFCEYVGNQGSRTMTLTARESCPSGEALKCTELKGTMTMTSYLYGTLPAGFTCASMGDDD